MRSRRAITVVGCHAGGEVGNVIVGGVLPPPGATVFEQMQTLRADDSLRRLLLREPRGSVAVHANLVVPATRRIATPATSSWSRPSIRRCRARTRLRRDRPARDRHARAAGARDGATARGACRCRRGTRPCRDGRVESVELTNVPAFADRLDAALEVEGLGTLTVDVAFGGMWYAIADAKALGFGLVPAEARQLSLVGELIRVAAREQLPCVHPENPEIAGVSIVQIAEPWRGVGEVLETPSSSLPAGSTARRPAPACRRGWRCCTRAPDAVGDSMTHASPIGSTFDGRIVSETTVGGRPAIVPAIRGSAWITGITQVFVDPDDPFPEGYLLSDTWPGADVQ